MANMLRSHQVNGTVYAAVFRQQNRFGSSPFVHGLVHSQRVKGDLSYSRFRAFASSEGLDIFAAKVLERDEVRSWGDLMWDLETAVGNYWLDVETVMVGGDSTARGAILQVLAQNRKGSVEHWCVACMPYLDDNNNFTYLPGPLIPWAP